MEDQASSVNSFKSMPSYMAYVPAIIAILK